MKFVCPLLVVKDINQSKEFYEKILEQKIKYDFGENVTFEGDFAIHLKSHYEKLLNNDDCDIISKSNNFELYFETNKIEEIYLKLKNEKVEFVHEINEQPWGQRVIRLYDPDYHIIEVGETMESVVTRLYENGVSVDEICQKTLMPVEFVEYAVNNHR